MARQEGQMTSDVNSMTQKARQDYTNQLKQEAYGLWGQSLQDPSFYGEFSQDPETGRYQWAEYTDEQKALDAMSPAERQAYLAQQDLIKTRADRAAAAGYEIKSDNGLKSTFYNPTTGQTVNGDFFTQSGYKDPQPGWTIKNVSTGVGVKQVQYNPATNQYLEMGETAPDYGGYTNKLSYDNKLRS
jgi:hypothetical protein